MAKFGDRVKETTDTTGTGTLDLNGAPTGFLAFADEFTDQDTDISYLIVDDPSSPTEFEAGKGKFVSGSPHTLERTTVERSSNSDSKVSFTSGTKTVVATPTAADLTAVFGDGGWGTKSAKVRAITSDTNQVAADDGKLIDADASGNSPATLTYTLLAEATAGDGFVTTVRNDGASGTVDVDDDAASLIATLQPGESITLRCDGTAWHETGDFLATVSQAIAEAGTSTARYGWTPQRVAQVVSALGGGSRGHLAGLALSNNGTDADHDIDIAVGECRSAADDATLILSSAITKQIDATWAVGTDAGGLDTGAAANSTWYAVWLIRRSDTGVVDALFSTSFSAPTMPTNYDQKRRLGAVLTDGSANITAFKQIGERFYWDVPVQDASSFSVNASSRTLLTVSTPPDVTGIFGTSVSANNGQNFFVLLASTDTADTLASASAFNIGAQMGSEVGGSAHRGQLEIPVDASRQIGGRGSATITIVVVTHGWIDRRGRDD